MDLNELSEHEKSKFLLNEYVQNFSLLNYATKKKNKKKVSIQMDKLSYICPNDVQIFQKNKLPSIQTIMHRHFSRKNYIIENLFNSKVLAENE